MKNQVSLPLGHVNKQNQLAEIFSQLSDQIRPLDHVSVGVNNNRVSAIIGHQQSNFTAGFHNQQNLPF